MNATTLIPLALFSLVLSGCSAGSAGSEQAAKSHFQSEFNKWIAGESSEVTTMNYRINDLVAPIGYDIRSIVTDDPDPLAFGSSGDLPEDWRNWPAYKFNVAIEWKSKAGTPLEKVTTYSLTWNSDEKKWYVNERY